MKHAKHLFALLVALLVLAGAAALALAEATPGEPDRCTHPNATVTVKQTNVQYKSVDARSHTKGYDEVTIVDCPDCDAGDSVTTTYKQLSEAHTMKNGACTLCGYKASAKATPKPAAKPAAQPAAPVTPAPTPTPAPTAAPVPPMPEMARMLLDAARLAQFEGENVSVEIVGAQAVFTADEAAILAQLPVEERILLTLSAVGMADVTETALASEQTVLSEAAQALDRRVADRMLAMSEEEKAALNAALDEHFPIAETVVGGKLESLFSIELLIVVDGEARVQRYGFAQDANGEWALAQYAVQEIDIAG